MTMPHFFLSPILPFKNKAREAPVAQSVSVRYLYKNNARTNFNIYVYI